MKFKYVKALIYLVVTLAFLVFNSAFIKLLVIKLFIFLSRVGRNQRGRRKIGLLKMKNKLNEKIISSNCKTIIWFYLMSYWPFF